MTVEDIDRDRIVKTRARIASYIRRTPVVEVDGADFGLKPVPIDLKLELLQHSGSFKARGAFANLLARDIPPAGVAAASGGNHGAAVAYAAMRLAVPAKVFVPTVSSPAKIERIRAYGADIVVKGDRYADALAESESWIAQSGALDIHAFDQPQTLLGQGTLGLEMEQQAPNLDTLLVSVGGGGLIGGIAAWYAGGVRIVGVEPIAAPTLHDALAAGRPVERVALVTDDAIRGAQEALWNAIRIVAEPGGTAAFAALWSGAYEPQPGERVGVVISGGNTTAVDFSR